MKLKTKEVQVVKKEVDIVPKFEVSVDIAKERLEELNKFIESQMLKGKDYGVVPGISKPTLFKSGAEKLENIYGFYHEFEELEKIQDFKEKFCFYRYKCVIYHKRTGIKQAEAVGSCNNKERARVNQDFYTTINTIDKMAQKRAFVGAILNACRVSSTFTQDVEDMGLNGKSEAYKKKIAESGYVCESCKTAISKKVAEFSNNAYKKILCMRCQSEVKKKETVVM
jgi:hypothetical protein